MILNLLFIFFHFFFSFTFSFYFISLIFSHKFSKPNIALKFVWLINILIWFELWRHSNHPTFLKYISSFRVCLSSTLRHYMAGKLVCLFEGLKPTIAMVMIQITFGGIHVLYKLAKNDGMSMKIMIAYRMIFATASMVPLALILERWLLKYLSIVWSIFHFLFIFFPILH